MPSLHEAAETRALHSRTYVLIGLAVILAVIAIFLAILAAHWPFSRDRMTRSLESALHARIAIGRYKETYFPPGCVAEDVAITPQGSGDLKATFKKVAVEASYGGLFVHRVRRIVLDGAIVILPPARGAMPRLDGNRATIVIDEIAANDSVLRAGKLQFVFHRLDVHGLGAGGDIAFGLAATIPKPLGELNMRGSLGAWNGSALGQAPLTGSYALRQADLGVFSDLGGRLSSEGKYKGTLSRLQVSGWTKIPDFEANHNGHQHHLDTRFLAVVDAMNGDTQIQSLRAQLDSTAMAGRAAVKNDGNPKGKTITLDVTSGRGRVQDLLLLFMKSRRAPMLGAITFETHVALPPDGQRFMKRVALDGAFDIAAADFTNPQTQMRADSLSEHAEGEPADPPEPVRENVRGRVSLRGGLARVSDLQLRVPGANVNLAGDYNLLDERVDLRGKMAMAAKLSQSTTGVKSFFLKLLDPFFKKKRAGAVIPVSLTGTYDHPVFQALMARKK